MGMSQHELELLTKYENDLKTTLDLTYLMPHLTTYGLLTSNEADMLNKPELTREDAIKKFLSKLKTKGQTAFSLFINALDDEKEHLGHASLFKVLSSEIHNRERLGMLDVRDSPVVLEPCLPSPNEACRTCLSSQGSSTGTSVTSELVSMEASMHSDAFPSK